MQETERERCAIDPWVGKIPWWRAWQPTPVFLPGEFHGQRSLAAFSLQGRKSVKGLSMLTFCLWTLFLPLFCLFLFIFSWLCYMACGMLVLQPKIEPVPPASHTVLTTELPGKYLCLPFTKIHVSVFRTHQLIQNYLFILWILTWSHIQRLFFLIK